MGGDMNGIKYCLFGGNLLFLISGIALVTIGGLMTTWYGHYSSYSADHLPHVFILVILLGVVVCLVGFLGCCGALISHHCMLVAFTVLVGLMLTLELTAAVFVFKHKPHLEEESSEILERSVRHYDTNKTAAHILDLFQTVYKCCGKSGALDYGYRKNGIPGTCCGGTPRNWCRFDASFKEGCHKSFHRVVTTGLAIGGWLMMVFAGIHLVAGVLACVYVQLRKRRRIMKYSIRTSGHSS